MCHSQVVFYDFLKTLLEKLMNIVYPTFLFPEYLSISKQLQNFKTNSSSPVVTLSNCIRVLELNVTIKCIKSKNINVSEVMIDVVCLALLLHILKSNHFLQCYECL